MAAERFERCCGWVCDIACLASLLALPFILGLL